MTKAESGQMHSSTLKQPSKFKLFALTRTGSFFLTHFSLLWELCADRGIKSSMMYDMAAYDVSKLPIHILKKAKSFLISPFL